MSDKSINELGKEYINYINLNEENIKYCKSKIKNARENNDELSVRDLQKSLSELYKISRDLKEISVHLIKYYS